MKHFFIALALSVPLFSLAQSNFQKGYIVNNSNDTLRGYINYREREANPTSVSFKPELTSEAQTLKIRDCAAYGIGDIESYQRFVVNITSSKININNLSKGVDLSYKRDTVLLKQLQTGKNVSLYTYTDKIKLRFYIKENDIAEPAELISQLYLKENQPGVVVTGKTFIRQLQKIMNKYNPGNDAAQHKFYLLRYTEADLIKAVSAINGQQPILSKIRTSRFFAGGGLNINKAKYKGQNDFASEGASNKVSYTPLITIGVDLFANPVIGKIIYRAELSFQMSQNEISATTTSSTHSSGNTTSSDSHSFDQYGVVLTPQVIYNLYNTTKLKFFLGAGAGINFSTYKNNSTTRSSVYSYQGGSIVHGPETTENEAILEKFYFSIPVTAGVVLNKKIELSAGYTFPAMISDYRSYNIYIQRFKIGVNYLFDN